MYLQARKHDGFLVPASPKSNDWGTGLSNGDICPTNTQLFPLQIPQTLCFHFGTKRWMRGDSRFVIGHVRLQTAILNS